MYSFIINPLAKCTHKEGPTISRQEELIERASYWPGAGSKGSQRQSHGISGGESQAKGRGSDWIFPESKVIFPNTDQNKALFRPGL